MNKTAVKKRSAEKKKAGILSEESELVCDLCGFTLEAGETCACEPWTPIMYFDEDMSFAKTSLYYGLPIRQEVR